MSLLYGFLRIDQIAIHLYLKSAATRGYHLQFIDYVLVVGQQFVRQTDGSWLVVSSYAILD